MIYAVYRAYLHLLVELKAGKQKQFHGVGASQVASYLPLSGVQKDSKSTCRRTAWHRIQGTIRSCRSEPSVRYWSFCSILLTSARE